MDYEELVVALRKHVKDRGGPTLENGTWQMMLDAAEAIERLIGDVDAASYSLEG